MSMIVPSTGDHDRAYLILRVELTGFLYFLYSIEHENSYFNLFFFGVLKVMGLIDPEM